MICINTKEFRLIHAFHVLASTLVSVPNTQLSCNPVNTESFLYGINSTNLVHPAPKFTTIVKCEPGIEFFNRPQAYLPPPLVVPNCQRPQGPFC